MGDLAPGVIVGRFRLDRVLGRGGMGEVWKADDLDLQRPVALKFVLAADGEDAARFRREAQAGTLSHPGIAAVYETGVHAGRPWLAMEFVDGRTLSALPPREAAAAIRDAAIALHHAHERGLIHRDVKPQNLMIDKAGRVRVMDFGLARTVASGSTLTASGMMVGTPAYMSPEQARGEVHALDARTDVYGLGASLYALLAGRPPFEGSDTLEIAMRVIEEDPAPPPGPPDLAAVAMRCLEKDPARRYRTARELADDLDRFLRGEPVAARRLGAAARLLRRLRRRRGLVGAVAVAGLAAAAGLCAVAVRGRGVEQAEATLSAKERELSAAQREALTQLRATFAATMESALEVRRLGSVEALERRADAVRDLARRAVADLPGLAEPHYRIGRLYRALVHPVPALQEQERALAKEPGFGPSRYERLILRQERHRERLLELWLEARHREGRRRAQAGGGTVEADSRGRVPSLRELASADAECRALSRGIHDDLQACAVEGLRPGEAAFVRGMRAMEAGDRATARARFREAVERAPETEEGWEALGSMEMEDGRMEEALAVWVEACERDQGYLSHRASRAFVLLQRVSEARRAGRDPRPALDECVRYGEELVRRWPHWFWGWSLLGQARGELAFDRAAHDGDPLPLYAAAAEAFGEAVRRRPGDAIIREMLALTRTDWAARLFERGGDPSALVAEGLREIEELDRLAPGRASVRKVRGILRANEALLLERRGGDAMAAARAAVEDLGEALKGQPEDAEAWCLRGAARANLAVGAASEELARASLEDFGEALARDPSCVEALAKRALARMHLGLILARTARDPEPCYRDALEDLARVAALDPRRRDTAWRRGAVRVNWGEFLLQSGRDPRETLEAAVRDFAEAAERDPSWDEPWRGSGDARLNLALYLSRTGGASERVSREAIDAYGEALKRNPGREDTWLARGQAKGNLAAHTARGGGDARPLFEDAIGDHDEALKRNPGRADAWASRGDLRAATAPRSADPGAVLDGAAGDYREAARLAPSRADHWRTLGALLVNAGLAAQARGGDPLPRWRDAGEALDRAVALAPRDATAWLFRGNARFNAWRAGASTEDAAEARRSYRRAAELDPALAPRVAPMIEILDR